MKLSNQKKVNRLVIYFFYDADGIVDRYVPYMLNDMKKNCSELLVICNGKLTHESRKTLLDTGVNVYVRQNVGFDVWAYKEALELYGWEKLEQYDEVLLMNYTLFGPLYPFSEVFASMNERDVDFWGLTKYYSVPFDPFGTIVYGYIPDHIQSSFICIRKDMLKSREFHDHWDNMKPVNSYEEAIGYHEAIFTKKFNDCGFISDVYINTDDLREVTEYPLMNITKELAQDFRCPVIKRRAFFQDYIKYFSCCTGEPAVEVFRYIKENLNYDLDMVWENIIRTSNMANIKDCMHLNYILPRAYTIQEEDALQTKTALFMHIYYNDLIDYSVQLADSMPDNSDIYFITASEKNIKDLEDKAHALKPRKVTVLKAENRGRDVSALVVTAAPYIEEYEVICFAHDKKTKQVRPWISGMSWGYQCFENILGSKQYTKNIITKFKQEKRLGIAMPPVPMHGEFYGIFGAEWGPNFDLTVKLAKKLKIDVPMDQDCEPIAPLGTMFWCRPKALKPLYRIKWKYSDFPEEPNANDGTLLHAFERVYSYAAQSQGYYAAWLMNDSFASIAFTDYHYIARETTKRLFDEHGRQPLFQLLQSCDAENTSNSAYVNYQEIMDNWKSSLAYSELLEEKLSEEQSNHAQTV